MLEVNKETSTMTTRSCCWHGKQEASPFVICIVERQAEALFPAHSRAGFDEAYEATLNGL